MRGFKHKSKIYNMNKKIKTNPLIGLIGIWEGDKGVDLAPKPKVDENNP